MPIREYRCQKCGEKFERLIFSGGEENDLACPKCGAKEPKRVMSVFTGLCPNGGTGAARAASGGGCSTCSGGSCSTCGN